MALDLNGKVALVTGGGRGICLSFVEKLLNRGTKAVIADLALSPEAEQLVKKHESSCCFQKTDVTEWDQLQAAFDRAMSAYGRLDIVCPGAAILEPPKHAFWHYNSSADSPATSTYKTLEINITHPIRCTQLAIDYFLRQKLGHGVVIHFSSAAAQAPHPTVPLYGTSKAAVSQFVRCMAVLEETHNIRVNAIAPSNVKTSFWTESGRHVYADDQKDLWCTPSSIADVMIDMVTKPQFVGGSVWEVSIDHLRKVELLNDPGSDTTKPGFTLSNVGIAMDELEDLMGKNFGK